MADNERPAELEIERVLYRFFQALDERRYDDQVTQVAENGTWLRQGKLLTGPDEIRSAMEERPVDFHTAHLISNLIVEPAGSEALATFVSSVLAHRGEVPEGEHPPVTLAQVARYDCTFTKNGAAWRIQSLRSAVLFKPL